MDGKQICASVTEPGVGRRVLCIDAGAGGFAGEQTGAFSSLPFTPRLLGLAFTGGAMQLLWQRDGQFVDRAPMADGAVIGLVSNEGIDATARDATPSFATSSVVRIDPLTGAETARVDLGTALAETRDASLFAFGTRLAATDGSVRDTANGAVIGRLG